MKPFRYREILSPRLRACLVGIAVAATLCASIVNNALVLDITRTGENLVFESCGETLSIQASETNLSLDLDHEGPDLMVNDAVVVQSSSIGLDALAILRRIVLRVAGVDAGKSLSLAVLSTAPAKILIWNPHRDRINLMDSGGSRLAVLRIDSVEGIFKVESQADVQEKQISPPRLRFIFSALMLPFLLGSVLIFLARFVSGLLLRSGPNVLPKPLDLAPIQRWHGIQILLTFLIGFTGVAAFHFLVFDDAPGFGDEMNYLVQARLLEAGRLFLKQPALASFFKVSWMDLLNDDGILWNFHPIGNSLLLALGYKLGVVSWIPAVIGGCFFSCLFLFAHRLFGSYLAAWLAVGAASSSHYVLSLLASYMAHGPALLFIVLCQLCLLATLQGGGNGGIVIAGISLGLAFLMRPLSLALSFPLIIALVVLVWRRRPNVLPYLIVSGCLALAISAIEPVRVYLVTGKWQLGYEAKGPEMGMYFSQRWAKGWDWRMQNLFQNFKFYESRVFGVGSLLNMLFFAIPAGRRGGGRWILAFYLTILFFWCGHSFLHFYGWKWEPRMMFEFTHLFIAISVAGFLALMSAAGRLRIGKIWVPLGCLPVVAFLLWNAVREVPGHAKGEYRNYNSANSDLRRKIKAGAYAPVVVFHQDGTKGFAPHMPDNKVSIDQSGAAFFTGPVVHAIDFGRDGNQALLAQYQDRRAIVVDDAGNIVEIQNFYRSVVPKINAALAPFREGHNISVGLPWLGDVDKNEAVLGLGKVRVFNALSYRDQVKAISDSGLPSVVVLAGSMTPIVSLLKNSFSKVEIETVDEKFSVIIAKIGASSFIDRKYQPGFAVAVFDSQNCQGRPSHWEYSVSLQFDVANLKDTCIQWLGEFDVVEDAAFTFVTVSDDGSGIWIDDVLVLDNNYLGSQGALRKEATVGLRKGHHKIRIQYSQWRGEAVFEGMVAKAGKEFLPIDATSFDSTVVAPDVGMLDSWLRQASRSRSE